jgi:hypothetical protein
MATSSEYLLFVSLMKSNSGMPTGPVAGQQAERVESGNIAKIFAKVTNPK